MSSKFQAYLLDLVVAVYQTYIERKGDKEIIKEAPGRVVRGTIPAVASKFEDEFGIFLYKLLGDENDYSILIDYPIRLKGDGRITPDVVVIKDGTIQLILELKNDLGYEKGDWREKLKNRIERLKKVNIVTYSEYNSDSRTKTDKTLYVPNDVPYGTVILCQKNGRKRVLDIINDCKEANCQGDKVPYFILMKDKDTHANDILFEEEMNDYMERVVSTDVTSDWIRLEFFLSKHLKYSLE
ncbi:hypothetical protein VE23_12505 [Paenibacillus sp. D9]|uniref:hypothetical protein n=1 Tax=Paenibacillus sp. D9 TaxID=665792 RepID=UPI00061ED308|nr:hypothetical protein [Paenibacillus sp. D9]KKC47742.1 hypothetical protein VE23_12505 [Paenibacillus sp. D9]